MRKRIVVGACVMLASAGVYAQHSIAEKHPVAPYGSASSARYTFETANGSQPIPLDHSRALLEDLVESRLMNQMVEAVTVEALYASRKLRAEDVGVALIRVNPSFNRAPRYGSYNGHQPFLASGLIRPFVAVAYEKHAQDKGHTTRLRAASEMFAPLDTRNTNAIIDHITGTRSGPALSPSALRDFARRRDYVNQVMLGMGYTNFNLNQKLITGAATGRDRQLLGRQAPQNFENSNRLTPVQVASMMYLIDQEAVVSRAASQRIKRAMTQPDFQAREAVLANIARELPAGSFVMGTNAYTASQLHDAAVFTLPNGERYVLVAMTRYDGDPTQFISTLSRIFIRRALKGSGDLLNIQLPFFAPSAPAAPAGK
jgi:hypothetical protein